MRKPVLVQFITFFVLIAAVFFAYAADPATSKVIASVDNTPIEGGIFLLLAITICYGGKVLYQHD